jgi:A/G-specific adenine glycosylase
VLDGRLERHHPALRPATDGSREVQRSPGGSATGQDETAQRRKLGLETIDQRLQSRDIRLTDRRLCDTVCYLVRRVGEQRAQREQVALDATELLIELAVAERRPRETDPGVQLVDLAVRVDPGVILSDPRAVEERRLAGIASARVDFHRSNYTMPISKTTKSSHIPAPPERRRFRQRLLAWYRRHGRDLPWRKTSDPYHILVSEFMLQQTQVDRVVPKYHEWLEKYPSLGALAAAPERDVTMTWYPLGYNIRPLRLQTIARESVARYGGELPADEATLRSFKGIGAYTAGAIRSFAFGERAAILDTNVARVLFRVFVGTGDSKSHRMKRHLWTLSETLMPARHVFDFNQALMDFGAMVCVARRPRCLICPMTRGCRSFPFDPDRS